jgi:hypothetical protein
MPDQLVLVRNSERAKFKECRQAWHWGYRHTLEPEHRRGALTFGGMAHDALADWYVPGLKRGTHPAETFMRLYVANEEEFNQWDDEGNRVPADELGFSMLTEYVEHYGDDPMIEIVESEMAFQIDVYDHKDNYLGTLVGRFDAIGRNRKSGWYFVFEHKTGKSIEFVRINSRYGEQGLSYYWAASYWIEHVLDRKIQLDGIGYNWLRKAMPDDRPQNAQGLYLNKPTKKNPEGEVSKRQPLPFFSRQMMRLGPNQLDTFNRRLRRELFEMSLVRQRKLGVYKSPGMHCNWCQFRDVCELHEMGEDWEDVLNIEFKKWQPYSDHELHLELVA